LETSVTTVITSSGEVLSRKKGKVDGSVAQQTGDEKRQAFDSSEIEFEGSELFDKMVIKHPNFGASLAKQAFSRFIYSFSMSYILHFCRVVCEIL
jgi:hypothetical protein